MTYLQHRNLRVLALLALADFCGVGPRPASKNANLATPQYPVLAIPGGSRLARFGTAFSHNADILQPAHWDVQITLAPLSGGASFCIPCNEHVKNVLC